MWKLREDRGPTDPLLGLAPRRLLALAGLNYLHKPCSPNVCHSVEQPVALFQLTCNARYISARRATVAARKKRASAVSSSTCHTITRLQLTSPTCSCPRPRPLRPMPARRLEGTVDGKAAKDDQQAARSEDASIRCHCAGKIRGSSTVSYKRSKSLVMSVALAMAFFSQAGNAGGSLVLHDRVPTACRYHRQASRERTVPLAHLQ